MIMGTPRRRSEILKFLQGMGRARVGKILQKKRAQQQVKIVTIVNYNNCIFI